MGTMSDEPTHLRPEVAPLQRELAIPHVTVGRQLGAGGMASVFEGLDTGFNPPRKVAVKLMAPDMSQDPEFRARFEREASIVADFRHDHIVHIYGCGEAQGVKYIVMELLAGGTLADKLLEGALPPAAAINVGKVLADALAYSHERGIVHRDFKPGNVLFTQDGKAVLSDFGVAKVIRADVAAMTRHAMLVGAPRYMSPEQARAEEVTDRSDIYSFGLTLFEMFTGRLPTANERAQDDTSADEALTRALPPPIASLVSQCLQNDPSRRPSAADCHRVLAELAPTSSAARRKRRAYAIAGAALLVAAIGILGYVRTSTRSDLSAQSIGTRGNIVITRSPEGLRLFADGAELAGRTAYLDHGEHQLVAVAPGFYGELRSIVAKGEETPLIVELRAVRLPNAQETERFFDLADAPAISQADVASITEWTLQTALRGKLLNTLGPREAAQQLEAQLAILARYGDARATVATLLGNAIREGRIGHSLLDASLISASDRGDAMASFFVAVAIRDSLREGDGLGSASSKDFTTYCARMSLSAAQGWGEVATPYLQRDSCG
jgi:hypothetical protein